MVIDIEKFTRVMLELSQLFRILAATLRTLNFVLREKLWESIMVRPGVERALRLLLQSSRETARKEIGIPVRNVL